MSIAVNEPHNLRATLAQMKSAAENGGRIMYIWDRDIQAVEEAVATIEAIRLMKNVLEQINAREVI